MTLFTIAKIPMYCDAIAHRLEVRKDGPVKVVELQLRVQPFTAQLAAALDPEYGFVKRMLFKQQDASAITDLKAVEFKAPTDRQTLIVFASADTPKASIALDQVKITKLRARTEKGVDGWALCLKACFGPLGKTELEYVNGFYTEQRWVTFEEAQPLLEFGPDTDDESDDDPEVRDSRPAPMCDTTADGTPVEATVAGTGDEAARLRIHSHAGKRPRTPLRH